MPVKSIPITLKDGKARHLRLEWEALNLLEKELGMSIFELGTDMMVGRLGFLKISKIIWAGLSYEEEAPSQVELIKLLEPEKISYYADIVADAFNAIFPKDEEKKVKGPNQTEN